jgi:small subunit ribosomal protein S1
VKQLEGDPFGGYVSGHDKGAVVTGTVKSLDAKGAVVMLEGDVEAYLKASEVSADRVEDIRGHLKEGDTVKAVIINVDRKNRGINLSIKALDKADTAAAMQKFAAENTSTAGTTNLGALLKAKLDSSKADNQ